jgi:predicted tellurium resistance membrane protein TerC
VVFPSNLLSTLMDRYPIILYIGAAILGRVAGEMILTDPAVVAWLAPSPWFRYAMEALFAVGVIVAGKLWLSFAFRRAEAPEPSPAPGNPPGENLSTPPSDEV